MPFCRVCGRSTSKFDDEKYYGVCYKCFKSTENKSELNKEEVSSKKEIFIGFSLFWIIGFFVVMAIEYSLTSSINIFLDIGLGFLVGGITLLVYMSMNE